MNFPKIGVTTAILDQKIWFKQLKSLNVNTIEIGGRSARLFFEPNWLEKIKPNLQDYDLSLHSGTVKIFTSNEQFTKTELERLKSEIIICEFFGIKELIFHLKNEKLTTKEEKEFEKIVEFSKKKNVDMIFESNGILVAKIVFDILKRFPDIYYNLDLGHLNLGVKKNMLGCDIKEFLQKIMNRVVYIHVHNNNGEKDQHKALRDGTLDWKRILDILDLSKIRKIITETKTIQDIEKDLEDIKNYLSQKDLRFQNG